MSLPTNISQGKFAIAGGLSASSNVLVLWLLLLQNISLSVIGFMWILALISGFLFGVFGWHALKQIQQTIHLY